MKDVYIIGGGAAGLAAAISAARAGARVTVLERGEKSGRKILATGGGRCNFTNLDMSGEPYYDGDPGLTERFLSVFPPVAALDFFYSLGVLPVIREGYVYPRSEEAASVAAALLAGCERLGVTVRNNTPVTSVRAEGDGFAVFSGDYSYSADRVVLAAGGCASPALGTDGSGYALAKSLGHSITPLRPALGAINHDGSLCAAAGTRVRAKVTLSDGGHAVCSATGEVQINERSISGIPVLSLCRLLGDTDGQQMELDFAPETDDSEIERLIEGGFSLRGLFPDKLARLIARSADPLAAAKYFTFVPAGAAGFENAHTVRGGVPACEIDAATFASRLTPGLYLAGEIIDIDGRCGGYNLHFAWASGVMAGFAAATGRAMEPVSVDPAHRALFARCETGSRRSG